MSDLVAGLRGLLIWKDNTTQFLAMPMVKKYKKIITIFGNLITKHGLLNWIHYTMTSQSIINHSLVLIIDSPSRGYRQQPNSIRHQSTIGYIDESCWLMVQYAGSWNDSFIPHNPQPIVNQFTRRTTPKLFNSNSSRLSNCCCRCQRAFYRKPGLKLWPITSIYLPFILTRKFNVLTMSNHYVVRLVQPLTIDFPYYMNS